MATVPLLGVAGTLCDGRLFDDVAAHLGLPIACSHPVRRPTVAAAADDVLASAPDRFIVVGFSLGTFVVLELLRRVSTRLAGAVLVNGNARPDLPENARSRRAQVASLRNDGASALIDRLWPDYVSPAAAGRTDLRDLLVEMAADTDAATFAAQADLAISRPDSRPSLAAIAVPLLVIGARQDRLCPADRQDEFATAPAATLVMVDAGHFSPVEAPAAVAGAIAAWSAGLTQG